MFARISLVLTGLLAVVAASNVLDLNSANFKEYIGKGKPALVEFFAPWCGHCKNLAPVYEQLADAFAHAKDKVLIVKVDADGEGKEIASSYGVKGFPTLKWFSANDAEDPTPYEGGRELDTLANFVSEKSGVKSNIKPPPPPATLQLNYRTFDDVVFDKEKSVLVAFTAPWCGHCKSMKPELEKVALNFKTESGCVVANYDADAAQNKEIASKYGVTGYPTIKFFKKGDDKEAIDYVGGRTEAAFTAYLNTQCGTHRHPGGGLNDEAGRIPEFDDLASQFFAAAPHARSSIYEQAVELSKTVGTASKHYLKVMEKIVNGTEEYLNKEKTRLSNILSKKSLASEKLDEIKIKANILAQFVERKIEEAEEEAIKLEAKAEEKAQEAIQRVKEEL